MKIEGACHPVISVCPFKGESEFYFQLGYQGKPENYFLSNQGGTRNL